MRTEPQMSLLCCIAEGAVKHSATFFGLCASASCLGLRCLGAALAAWHTGERLSLRRLACMIVCRWGCADRCLRQ